MHYDLRVPRHGAVRLSVRRQGSRGTVERPHRGAGDPLALAASPLCCLFARTSPTAICGDARDVAGVVVRCFCAKYATFSLCSTTVVVLYG